MRFRFVLAITVLAAGLFCSQRNAAADTITWTLSPNIPLSDGGTLNGSFTLDVYGYLNGNSWDLTTTAGSLLPGLTYTPYINASDPNNLTVQFFGPNYTSELNLVFEYSLLIPSADNPIIGGIGGPSFECSGFTCDPIRYVDADSGFASATPLPAALPLFAAGLSALGFAGWRRKKRNV
jgi:hypothetical protein